MEILLSLFYVVVGFLILNYLFFTYAFTRSSPIQPALSNLPPVSVIIAARNEAENLKHNLTNILKQDYPEFEVVVVNDRSTDATSRILEALQLEFSYLNVVEISMNSKDSGKKHALDCGINSAINDYLLFTDADCQPNSTKWISSMAEKTFNDRSIVIGYGGYVKENSILNKLVRFETLLAAIQYFSFAIIGKPYMAVGRNLLYSKQLFKKLQGFSSHSHLLSGDDDLFVQQAASISPVNVSLNHHSFTYSTPKTSWRNYINQKRRHISTASHYKWVFQLWLGAFYLANLLFWVLGLVLVLLDYQTLIVFIIFLLKFSLQSIIMMKASSVFREKDLLIYWPLLEPILVAFQLYIFILNLLKPKKTWN